MEKILPLLIIGTLILSGFGAGALYEITEHGYQNQIAIQISTFPSVKVKTTDDSYVTVLLNGIDTYYMKPGKPILPMIVKTFEMPFGAQNIKIEMTPGGIKEQTIEKQIQPSPPALPLGYINNVAVDSLKDEITYASEEPYPSSWYHYRIGCGINENNERVTFVAIHIFPVRYIPAANKLLVLENADFTITYDEPRNNPFPETSEYDLVIIAPSVFADSLQPLVDHKNSFGVSTLLKTTEEIYAEYSGVDKPEQIKYFIKDAVETLGVHYVLLVGGLKSMVYAKPRDNANEGTRDWYVPVRYTNLWDNPKFPLASESSIHDPGIISDLYYADLYKEGGVFEDWDHNDDGIFAAWGKPGVENDTGLDFYPDVNLGRLACRNEDEVKLVVNKIINYEKSACDPSWFKKMTVVSGDGFLDQQDLNIQWDTNGLPDGAYTIYGQSSNPDGDVGPVDVIHVTLDRTKETTLTFNHDDHLRISSYPGAPIAEIVTVSEGDVLGNTDYTYTPNEGEAYCNDFNPWANMSYVDGVLTIRGKSYDPKPYGNLTDIHVWVENDAGEVVFSAWRNNTEMYYEGEWTTGERALYGRGGALYYMPDDFQRDILWTSNGRFTGMDDILEALSAGSGFLFFSGHGSPNVWADHYPGVPGNRREGSVTGLEVTTLRPWPPFITFPVFPMDTISNGDKLPVAVVGGCHNSQFNVSMVLGVYDILPYFFPSLPLPKKSMWCHGVPVPETFSWRLISRPNGGAIATMGNTGLGYGMPGKVCTIGGGDSWITIEFFRQYGEEKHEVLGEAYAQTLTSYINTFDMDDLEAGHPKTIEQWVLLGDPSLKIGGYS